MDTFPQRLRYARKRANMSQGEVARRLGVKRQTVGNWETGLARPRAGLIPLLVEILNTNAAYLFGETDDPSPAAETYVKDPFREVDRALRQAGASEDDVEMVYQLLQARNRLRKKIHQLEQEADGKVSDEVRTTQRP